MKGYTFEFLSNGSVIAVEADDLAEALSLAPQGAQLLCSIDRKPQVFLAW